MADQPFNDFVPPEMRKFADQSVQQAKKAFDDLMTATQTRGFHLRGPCVVGANHRP